ncbi:MAG: hypothetical protein ACLQBB_15915 [Solirubrobacteraceae bacterium]
MSTKRACIFCGGTPLTKEHVVGRWARRFDKAAQASIVQICHREGRSREQNEWSALPYDRRARVVCAACNNGWMSQLESAASGLLHPDELDKRFLPEAEQALLARWALKTALVLNASQQPSRRVVSPEFTSRFGREQLLPAGVEVWLGSYEGSDERRPAFASVGLDVDHRQDTARGWRDLAVMTVVVGPFVFQVSLLDPKTGIDSMTRTFPPATRMCRLWPTGSARWYRHPGLSSDEVLAFAEQITTALRNAAVAA